ncbi:MAG: hypothetical protein KDB82_00180 [Planctomycetes bacterium]|nr:hypothetical protein [Planctomycetota bacterium]
MRTAMLLALVLGCASLHAELEPRDEALLKSYTEGATKLPGAVPVGYAHQFEVGDLQEATVLDRGVYRTIRLHVVAKLEDHFIVEVHNGRGLVFAGLMDNNGVFTKGWAGRAGEKPAEVEITEAEHPQALLHQAVRLPWSLELYKRAASSFHEGETFKVGELELAVQQPEYDMGGVHYVGLQSHGEDSWFGPQWQWTAADRVLYKVTRHEKLAKPEPLLDWSDVVEDAPKPAKATEWKPPKDEWEITKREDGSTLVFSYESFSRFSIADGDPMDQLHTPGPFLLAPQAELVLDTVYVEWPFQRFVITQAAHLPVVAVTARGAACSDEGLKQLALVKTLKSLALHLPVPGDPETSPPSELTAAGMKTIAEMTGLTDLAIVNPAGPELPAEFWPPLAPVKTIRSLSLALPEAAKLPDAFLGWTWLEKLSLWKGDLDGVGKLAGLTSLTLVDVPVSSAVAKQIVGLPNLTEFRLLRGKFPASTLSKLSKLTDLYINADAMDATWLIDSAAKLKSLKSLEIWSQGLVGDDLMALKSSSVENLTIGMGLERSEDVASLSKLANVRSLRLAYVAGVDAQSIAALAEMKGLSSLTLTIAMLPRTREENADLAALSKLSFLEELHVSGANMAKLGSLKLDAFENLKSLSLEELNLTEAVTAELGKCKSLESLSLRGSLLPKDGAAALEKLKSLKHLDLRQNYSVTDEELKAIKAALPGCEILAP